MKAILPLVTALFLAPLATLPAAEESKPNVIIVLTDDQGYGDLSLTGNPIPLSELNCSPMEDWYR